MKKIGLFCLLLSTLSATATQASTCYLDHGVFFCTAATELKAQNACKIGTGFESSGCSSEPDGSVGCQCDKRPSKFVGKKPFAKTLKLK